MMMPVVEPRNFLTASRDFSVFVYQSKRCWMEDLVEQVDLPMMLLFVDHFHLAMTSYRFYYFSEHRFYDYYDTIS
jgi:hypothetical protein